jgi:hypothetical protein
MSIKTEYTCEKCKKVEKFDGPMFLAKLEAAKLGWKPIKVGDNWEHHCGECRGVK